MKKSTFEKGLWFIVWQYWRTTIIQCISFIESFEFFPTFSVYSVLGEDNSGLLRNNCPPAPVLLLSGLFSFCLNPRYFLFHSCFLDCPLQYILSIFQPNKFSVKVCSNIFQIWKKLKLKKQTLHTIMDYICIVAHAIHIQQKIVSTLPIGFE